MHRPLIALSALFLAAPALAGGPTLTATPASAAPAKVVTQGASWNCGDAGCRATSNGDSRPAILCQRLAKEVGALSAFAADGKSFDEKQLARCNAKAR